jgi:alpha-D-ribose 1-methylphosphonate 5-triphosphate synthase subunit PhnL
MSTVLELTAVAKTFTMHLQGGIRLPVVTGVAFTVRAGECAVLTGRSGAGKSSILKMIFGTYRCDAGSIRVHADGRSVDVAQAEPRQILALRARALGYVSQFLRAIPRVPALDVVCEPLLIAGVQRDEARRRAADLLRRLNIPERLWPLPPATFSGGEQQRINIARGFISDLPLLLLDEPTAGLDPEQRVTFRALLRDLGQRSTVIVSTHLVEDVGAACTEVALMDAGKIVFHGTPGDLAARGQGHGTGDAPIERGYSAVLAAARS